MKTHNRVIAKVGAKLKIYYAFLLLTLIFLTFTSTPNAFLHFSNQASDAASSGFTYKIFAVSSSSNVSPNQTVVIRGTVCPNPQIGVLEGVGAQVTYIRPDGSNYTDSSLAVLSGNFDYCSGGSEGSDYIDSFTPDMQGMWHVVSIAYWQYDNGSGVQVQSNEISINVQPAGSSGLLLLGGAALVIIVAAVVIYFKKFRRASVPPPPPPPPIQSSNYSRVTAPR